MNNLFFEILTTLHVESLFNIYDYNSFIIKMSNFVRVGSQSKRKLPTHFRSRKSGFSNTS